MHSGFLICRNDRNMFRSRYFIYSTLSPDSVKKALDYETYTREKELWPHTDEAFFRFTGEINTHGATLVNTALSGGSSSVRITISLLPDNAGGTILSIKTGPAGSYFFSRGIAVLIGALLSLFLIILFYAGTNFNPGLIALCIALCPFFIGLIIWFVNPGLSVNNVADDIHFIAKKVNGQLKTKNSRRRSSRI